MTDIDDDDDDYEDRFEEFCAMTEAEQDAELEREMAAYVRWLDSLTPLQRYRYYRTRAVNGCLTWRKTIKMLKAEPGSIFHGYLRDRQKGLVRLRIERTTGIMPGTA